MDEPERKRRGPLRWIAAVVIGVLAIYVLSLPPLRWCIEFRGWIPLDIADAYFAPVNWLLVNAPKPMKDWVIWYVTILGDRPVQGGF